MEGEVLDLLLGQILRVVGFQGHAVVTHASRPMFAHPQILTALNLAILLVQQVVERRLLHHIPWILDVDSGRSRLGTEGNCRFLRDRGAI